MCIHYLYKNHLAKGYKKKRQALHTLSSLRTVLSLNLRSFKLSKLRAQTHLFLCDLFQTFSRPGFLNISFGNFPTYIYVSWSQD